MKKRKLLWGILLLILAGGILLFAVAPQAVVLDLPLWKLAVGALLLYWILDNAVFSEDIAERFQIFLPLSLLFVLFEKEIAALCGQPEHDLAHNGLVILGGLLIDIGFRLIFSGKKKTVDGTSKQNRFSSAVCYFDASKTQHTVSNRLGEITVYFQNIDTPVQELITLSITNRLGDVTIHVPSDWTVEDRINNHLGDVSIRENLVAGGRLLILTGDNHMGEVSVESP